MFSSVIVLTINASVTALVTNYYSMKINTFYNLNIDSLNHIFELYNINPARELYRMYQSADVAVWLNTDWVYANARTKKYWLTLKQLLLK